MNRLYSVEDDNIAEPNETLTISISKASASTDLNVSFNISGANVTIIDDDSEDIIHIFITSINLYYLMPTAAIIDFENITVNVNEGSPFATLFVTVLGVTRLGGEVTISFSTADITAPNPARGDSNLISLCSELLVLCSPFTAGSDYTSTVVSSLTFNQATTRRMVQVPIIHDSIHEPTEQFQANLVLVDNNGISVTVDPAMATVNIIDDDSELGI